MNLTVEIGFEQLILLIRQLPANQRKKLFKVFEAELAPAPPEPNNLQKLLLTGPVWTEKEYQNVLKTTEQLNQLGHVTH
jgi:hypothetical protein